MLLLLLVRFTACVVIYALIFIALAVLLFITYILYVTSLNLAPQTRIFNLNAQIVYKVLSCICLLVALIISTAFCCFHKRINIATKIIKTSARFVNQHVYLMFLYVIKIIFTIGFLLLWTV